MDETLKLYEKLIASIADIERKGKTIPYTSVNGHMFSQLSKEGNVGIRLNKEDREAFIEKYNTKLLETYGTTLKEYVHVPSSLLKKTKELSPYLKASFEYVKSLKPKPTTRKKKK